MQQTPAWRPALVLALFVLALAVLLWRALDLQVLRQDFLQGQGDARHLRVMEIAAHRGVISDRNGEALAISSPVQSVWAHPGRLLEQSARLPELARVLGRDAGRLRAYLQRRAGREFVYLERHVSPDLAEDVMGLAVPGVYLQREYRRFYPAGEVTGQLLGFTNVDDQGQEGVELAFDDWLTGTVGAKRVMRDRHGRAIKDVERLREARPGKPLVLSIDRRLQYLAYRELKAAYQQHKARSASLVLLDVSTNEVLAMVNQPAFNPNDRSAIRPGHYRNRAVTDVFEPGSTIKPFTVAAALESGEYQLDSVVHTSPGVVRVGGHPIRDPRDYGTIDLATVLHKSSTVGAAKLALELPPDALWGLLARSGFGMGTGAGFPGESGGHLASRPPRRPIERATLAYGYGLSATPLQLAQAYSVLAADGALRPVSFLRSREPAPAKQVLSPELARAVRQMMEGVVANGGTGRRAAVPGYRIAGKTGTSKKSVAGGYADDRYVALFAGMAPASKPRLVCVVVIDEPRDGKFYGGLVAAPVFSKVMGGALRLLNVPPDDLPAGSELYAVAGGVSP
ncbi:penicillin-binding protein 2 [Alkalilimnicola sp. S0819]|nr:penicillin-binding protein 2 [Alkalilimnicola sp. S0819]MPQ16727.1 penicillin-binding protein 2 [Alkalilimnicola sp. S0819]